MATKSPSPSPSPLSGPGATQTLTLETTHRLTPSISLHVFSLPPSPCPGTGTAARNLRPSEHLTLQFPPDLDPIAGGRNITEQDRCLVFTPCQLPHPQDETPRLSLLARNGRVTGLLGLPRPNGPLTAELVSVGGGFPRGVLDRNGGYTCIAGGTGVACFAAMGASSGWGDAAAQPVRGPRTLLASVRGDDFGVLEHLLDAGMLRPGDWSRITIFVTAGDEQGGLINGKPVVWWENRLSAVGQRVAGDLHFELRRMEMGDVDVGGLGQEGTILFCGSRSLEWQVKMWAIKGPAVYTTERT